MRIRKSLEIDTSIYYNAQLKTTNPLGSVTYVHQPGKESGFCSLQRQKSMEDRKTPGYFRAKREGKILPVGPCTQRVLEPALVQPGSTWFEYTTAYMWNPTGWQYRGDCSGVLAAPGQTRWLVDNCPPAQTLIDFERTALCQEALARAQTDAWDTATFLAELGKTIEMFTTLAGRVRLIYDRFQSKLPKGRVSVETAQQIWLELRYGWRPVVYDMLAVAEVIRRLQEGIDDPLVRGWAASSGSSTRVTRKDQCGLEVLSGSQVMLAWPVDGSNLSVPAPFGYSSGGVTNGYVTAAVETSYSARATVGVQVTTRETTMFDMAVTAYELIPYSFIWEWFINLGDAIAAFSPFATGCFKYGTYTVERTSIMSLVGLCIPTRPDSATSWKSGPAMTSSLTQVLRDRRRVVVDSVQPDITFRPNLDLAKIIDLVAIGVGIRRDLLKRIKI